MLHFLGTPLPNPLPLGTHLLAPVAWGHSETYLFLTRSLPQHASGPMKGVCGCVKVSSCGDPTPAPHSQSLGDSDTLPLTEPWLNVHGNGNWALEMGAHLQGAL